MGAQKTKLLKESHEANLNILEGCYVCVGRGAAENYPWILFWTKLTQ